MNRIKNIPDDVKARIGKLVGSYLIKNHGKKRSYSKRQVREATLSTDTAEFAGEVALELGTEVTAEVAINWLYSLYLDRATFEEYCLENGMVPEYDEMKSSMTAAITNQEYVESDEWLNFDWDLSWFEFPEIDLGEILGEFIGGIDF